ncbi:molybdopterin-dependent oxidoreductase [Halorussus gelatinilyticus]|uniref:Molybdopterin-dependent oxidoreductase n=1 Tax=Halorussus gelatinilyticus TaxID=2937524 RepID=A0A8U0IK21_9EURY|nr:molybdopterin-dependent oxidoreductase [Halorussus gelatinilyticus]UPW01423.1 molybdopterin-dependent oxidoreductase [Halorussus gelatinilyticus]
MHSSSVESTEVNDENRRALADRERPRIEVVGRETVIVSPGIDLPRANLTCTVECASGVRATDEWTGVPVAALADAADFSGDTTHLRVESADFAADVPIRPALGGIVAFERRGDRDDGEVGLPRLVADGVPGERLVKRVERVSAVALNAEEEPRVG